MHQYNTLLGSDVFTKHFQSVFSISYPKVHWKSLREKYVIRTLFFLLHHVHLLTYCYIGCIT